MGYGEMEHFDLISSVIKTNKVLGFNLIKEVQIEEGKTANEDFVCRFLFFLTLNL
jgi:hypothetical protein